MAAALRSLHFFCGAGSLVKNKGEALAVTQESQFDSTRNISVPPGLDAAALHAPAVSKPSTSVHGSNSAEWMQVEYEGKWSFHGGKSHALLRRDVSMPASHRRLRGMQITPISVPVARRPQQMQEGVFMFAFHWLTRNMEMYVCMYTTDFYF